MIPNTRSPKKRALLAQNDVENKCAELTPVKDNKSKIANTKSPNRSPKLKTVIQEDLSNINSLADIFSIINQAPTPSRQGVPSSAAVILSDQAATLQTVCYAGSPNRSMTVTRKEVKVFYYFIYLIKIVWRKYYSYYSFTCRACTNTSKCFPNAIFFAYKSG